MQRKEENIHNAVCQYLKLQYPNVLFITDMSGVKLSIGSAVKAKKQRCATYKIPDLTILHPAKGFHGLSIEIKKDVSEVFKKNGELKKNQHIEAQNKSILHLKKQGYKALFGCGFEHCKNVIDSYLQG